jgi:MYXO-CTERM domain-containing protein
MSSQRRGTRRARYVQTAALAAGLALLASGSAKATLYYEDGFNYGTGQLAGNAGWTNNSSNIAVTANSLTYPGLADTAVPGNAVTVTSGSTAGTTNTNFNASAITGGNIYYSFLAQVTALPTANNYLTSLLPTAGTPNGSTDPLAFYAGQQTAGSTYKAGIRHNGIGTGATFAASNPALTLNSTHFFVVEYTFNAAAADDAISLFVDPVPGAPQPLVPSVTVSGGGTDAANLQVIGFKAQSVATAGNWIFDTARVGDTWADVTPAAVGSPEPSALLLAGLGGIGLIARRRARLAR